MELSVAENLAIDLTGRFAPTRVREGWEFGGFDRAKVRAGVCRYSIKRWMLSKSFVLLNDYADVRETCLHEIAHVKVGPGFGHGAVWRAAARSMGGSGAATYDSKKIIMPDTPLWWGICRRNPDHRVGYQRKPGVRTLQYGLCPKCRGSLRWLNTRTGAVIFFEGGREVYWAGGDGV